MCDIFSWIVDKNGKVWFCEDKDCIAYMELPPEKSWNDVVGHETIRELFGVKGSEFESVLSVPAEIRDAVNAGRCDRMLKENGWAGLRYGANGKISSPWWPGEFIDSLKNIGWFDNHGKVDPAWRMFDTGDAAGVAAARADAAWAAAARAAGDAALYARCVVAWGAKSRNKHMAYAKKHMAVWQAGYGLLCDVHGVLYVYRRP
jgi:hypothetical protein